MQNRSFLKHEKPVFDNNFETKKIKQRISDLDLAIYLN